MLHRYTTQQLLEHKAELLRWTLYDKYSLHWDRRHWVERLRAVYGELRRREHATRMFVTMLSDMM